MFSVLLCEACRKPGWSMKEARRLRALQQNRSRASQDFFTLFYDKEQVIFFKNSTSFTKRALLIAYFGVVSTVLYTLLCKKGKYVT